MAARRTFAGVVLALSTSVILLACSQPSPEGIGPGPAAPPGVQLQVLPPIVAPGKTPQNADAALTALVATTTPATRGRTITLQTRTGDTWHDVEDARTDARGRAEFAAPTTTDGQPLTYRVLAEPFKGRASAFSAPADTTAWLTPTLSDEFTGQDLSPAWSHRGTDYQPISLRACSRADASAVHVRDGTVRLSVLDDPAAGSCQAQARGEVAGEYAYRLNGHISTENTHAFTYGVAAARMKMQSMRGQHASFWLQPVGGNAPGSAGHEIDVIEYFGDNHPRGGMTSFVHRYEGDDLIKTGSWIKNSRSFLAGADDSWSQGYHVFSVEWTPTTLIFRIDGRETWRVVGDVSSTAQFPILSLLSSDYELSQTSDIDLPQHAHVDWVRIWETGA